MNIKWDIRYNGGKGKTMEVGSFGALLENAILHPDKRLPTEKAPEYLAFRAAAAMGLNGSFSIHRSFPRIDVKSGMYKVSFSTKSNPTVWGDKYTIILVQPDGAIKSIQGGASPIILSLAEANLARSYSFHNNEVRLRPQEWAWVMDSRGQETLKIEEAKISSGASIIVCMGDKEEPYIQSVVVRKWLDLREQEMATEFIRRHIQHRRLKISEDLWDGAQQLYNK